MFFDFEKFDVSQVALDFVVSADEVALKLPKGRRDLQDQLLRMVAVLTSLARSTSEKNPNLR